MKFTRTLLGAAVAMAAVTSTAQAQSLNGMQACFINNSSGSVSGCNTSTTSWSLPGSSNSDIFRFDRADAPGGGQWINPSYSGSPSVTGFLYLGWFRFTNNSNNGPTSTANLRMQFFAGSDATNPWLTYDLLGIKYNDRGSYSAEDFQFTSANWSSWTAGSGGYEYRFRVAGFDYPHPGSNYCSSIDEFPSKLNKVYYSDANGGKLCGQFERRMGQPNTVVPEPSTYALMAAGLAGVFGFARRRRQTNA
jgi:hypothetical protein